MKDFRIISPQGIHISYGYKGAFIYHFHDENDSYTELDLEENKTGWQKAESVERFYIKYDPKNNLPIYEATIPNKREMYVKGLKSPVYVTNEANHNLTPSQKGLLQCYFRLVNIGFQHVQ